uniref:U8 snoRNA-decapping enzyme n=1 Tax=Ciona intestinalis TaxID=7719 RepID=F6ZA49_CIOIN|nr:U8 snoRNA-decapping enzyme-like isoform X2 [Ciona intestinalis]|eukprot:XP_002132010.1 U8 snoRNA-decapping enzyme-like isoform X2 [Ciona intestinalis]
MESILSKRVNRNETEIEIGNRKIAAHAFLYSPSTKILFNSIPMRYSIMMQIRFDGKIGFPGGLIDKGENIEFGLNRELKEEIGLEEKFYLDESNYVGSYVTPKLVDHFYVKEYFEKDLERIERGVLEAKDWGGETLGLLRVPVHTLHDNRKPLPAFLLHNFIADARDQLIHSIVDTDVLSESEMNNILVESQQLKDKMVQKL